MLMNLKALHLKREMDWVNSRTNQTGKYLFKLNHWGKVAIEVYIYKQKSFLFCLESYSNKKPSSESSLNPPSKFPKNKINPTNNTLTSPKCRAKTFFWTCQGQVGYPWTALGYLPKEGLHTTVDPSTPFTNCWLKNLNSYPNTTGRHNYKFHIS